MMETMVSPAANNLEVSWIFSESLGRSGLTRRYLVLPTRLPTDPQTRMASLTVERPSVSGSDWRNQL